MHAQTVQATEWWQRPRLEKTQQWIAEYQKSLRTRHRLVISRIVGDLQPHSLVEIGCHCGPNLIRLANDHPSIETLVGLDVNTDAIEAGKNWVAAQGLSSRIGLMAAKTPEATQQWPDRSVDVVLSCYALAYIAPPDLDSVLWELGRIAAKAIVLAEPMTDGLTETHTMLNGYQEWAHNYHATAKWMSTWSGMTLKTAIVDPPVDRLARVLVAVRE